MTTLTYGLKLPASGDRGASVFTALEGNITQLDGHTHNGANSAKLGGSAIQGAVNTASSLNWVAQGGGMYSQVVTLNVGYNYDQQQIVTKLTSTKEYVFAKLEKVSTTQVRVWSNDNTVSFDLLVGG